MYSLKTYKGLAIVLFVSVAIAALFYFIIPSEILSTLAAIPAIGALFLALFQLARDHLTHERAVWMEESKNHFTIGATSHMAGVAFDKHVMFCEEYTKAVNEALQEMVKRGPHESALEAANKLYAITTKWNVWLTPEMEAELDKFGRALRTIGSNAWLTQQLSVGERQDSLRRAYSTFAAVMGWETWGGEPVTDDVAAVKTISGVRKILGTEELNRLRTELIKNAIEAIKREK